MSEELKNVEVENALTVIFERLDKADTSVADLGTRIDGVQVIAERAASAAASAKSMAANVRTVPTNGCDVFLGILGKTTKVAVVGLLCWAAVKCCQAIYRPIKYEPPKYTNYNDPYFGETFSEWRERQEKKENKE